MNQDELYLTTEIAINLALVTVLLVLAFAAFSWALLQLQKAATERENTDHAYQGNLTYRVWKRHEFMRDEHTLLREERDHFGITAVEIKERLQEMKNGQAA